jgi:hypothetical protein
MQYLNLRGNKLNEFPQPVSMGSITPEHFVDSQQLLKMEKLQILDLSRNNLGSLPDELKAMKSLRVLSVMHNQLNELPLSIGGLDSLRILKMAGNPLNDHLRAIIDNNGNALSPQTTPIAENEKDALLTLKIKQFLRSQLETFESGGESR